MIRSQLMQLDAQRGSVMAIYVATTLLGAAAVVLLLQAWWRGHVGPAAAHLQRLSALPPVSLAMIVLTVGSEWSWIQSALSDVKSLQLTARASQPELTSSGLGLLLSSLAAHKESLWIEALTLVLAGFVLGRFVPRRKLQDRAVSTAKSAGAEAQPSS